MGLGGGVHFDVEYQKMYGGCEVEIAVMTLTEGIITVPRVMM